MKQRSIWYHENGRKQRGTSNVSHVGGEYEEEEEEESVNEGGRYNIERGEETR